MKSRPPDLAGDGEREAEISARGKIEKKKTEAPEDQWRRRIQLLACRLCVSLGRYAQADVE